jgi:hypothetical protein
MSMYMGVKEVTLLFNWSSSRVSVSMKRNLLIDPDFVLSATPVWSVERLLEFAFNHHIEINRDYLSEYMQNQSTENLIRIYDVNKELHDRCNKLEVDNMRLHNKLNQILRLALED